MLAFLILLLTAAGTKAFANPACAVCTVAVGASLEIARRMGVDDGVVGVWSGAFLLLLGYWTLKWMDKKGWNFPGRDFTILAASVAMIGFIYISHLVYTPKPILFLYIDPFLFAWRTGSALFFGVLSVDETQKRRTCALSV